MTRTRLPQIRRTGMDLFPGPEDGETVRINPPPFYWLRVEGVDSYRIEVINTKKETVVDAVTGDNRLLLRRPLPPGDYRWNLYAGERERGWQEFEIARDAVEHVVPTAEEVLATLPPVHPRHIYRRGDREAIAARHPEKLAVLRRNVETALANGLPPRPAFHHLPPDERRLAYRAAFGRHRDFADRDLVACALGHLFLDDPRAGGHARAVFLELIDRNPEPSGPNSVAGLFGDEIGLSHTRCLFAVYDWLHDLFDEHQHRYIAETLIRYARQIFGLLESEDFGHFSGRSHSGRLPAYLGEAALVLHGVAPDDEVRAWLRYALNTFGSFFPHYGDADGGWAEGVFYGSSYTRWYLPFFFALERHTGFSFLNRPFYRNVSHFFLHFAPPGWEIHPFGDGYWCLPDDEEWPGFFAQDPFGVYAERFGPELARRFARMLPEPDIYKLHLLDRFPLPPRTAAPETEPARSCRHFRGTGLASMHSDIANPASDTAVLVRASRYGPVSHQHADQGNFAVISRGKGLITPSGYFGPAFGSGHHAAWTRQTRAHNCVLVDGEGQPADDFRATGKIESLAERGNLAWTRTDLAAAYPGRLFAYRRTLLFLRPELVVVVDDLRAEKDAVFTWLAHTLSPPAIDGSRVAIRREPASLELRLFTSAAEPLSPRWTDRFAVGVNDNVPAPYRRDFPVQYHLSWEAPPAARRRFAAVITLNGASAETAFETGAHLVVRHAGRHLGIECDPDRPENITLDGEPIG